MNADLFSRLAPLLPYLLGGLGVCVLLILVYLVLVLRKARGGPGAAAGAAPAGGGAAREGGGLSSVLHVRRSFADAMRTLRSYVPGKDFRYRVPWVLVVGEEGSGKSTVLTHLGIDRPLPAQGATAGAGCRWDFFVDGMVLDVPGELFLRADGEDADEPAWHALLRLLQLHRTERPLDALVLTIPATDLVGSGAPGREALAAKAEAVYRRLWEAQRVLGMRLPVYVLVTRCDHLPGFGAVCGRLTEALKEEAFGWSSPYPVEAAFAPEWMDEAFDALHQGLYEAQLELLSQAGAGAEGDAIFGFPDEFRRMLPALRGYLAEVFKQSAYHESFFFRGVYFTGDGSGPAAEPARAPRPAFVTDLFRKKVFPESGLARPLPRALVSRHRTVRMAQAAMLFLAVVGGLGLWWSHARLMAAQEQLYRSLVEIRRELAWVHQQGQQGESGHVAWEGADVSGLLADMSAVETGYFWALAMPTSWVSGIRDDVDHSMAAAFSELIFPAVRRSLRAREDSLFAAGPDRRPGASTDPREVYAYLREVRELSENVQRYNSLTQPDAASMGTMDSLVAYVLRRPPARGKSSHHAFYYRALRQASGEPIQENRTGPATDRAGKMVEQIYDHLLERLDTLGAESQRLSRAQHTARDLDGFRRLRDDLAAVQGFFSESEDYWLDPKAELGDSMQTLLRSFPDSGMVSPAQLREQFERRFRATREQKLRRLRYGVESYGSGYDLLAAPGTGGGGDAPGAVELRNALRTLHAQGFAGAEGAVPLRFEPAAGSHLEWDPVLLERALAYHQEYQTYLQGTLGALPPGSREFVRGLATVQLEARLTHTVAQARRSTPAVHAQRSQDAAAELRDRVARAQPGAERLRAILEVFRTLRLQRPYEELAGTLLSQEGRTLQEVNRLLDQAGLYAPRSGDFGWWNGSRPVAPAAFAAGDSAGVEEYLARERARVGMLVERYALPTLRNLESGPLADAVETEEGRARVSPALLSRWRTLAAQLDGYQARTPGNSLAALEEFIRSGMDAADVGNCATAAGGGSRASGDYFVQARERLRRALHARCVELAGGEAVRGYGRIQDRFQRTLAGRFPFAPADDREAEADPQAVRDFFRLYDELAGARRAVRTGAGGVGGPGSAPAAFLEQMDRVRAFLAPLLEDTLQGPAYRVATEFRVNRARESGGDQIVRWHLDVGPGRLTPFDSAGRALPWYPGDGVAASLRWADHSEVRPSPAGLPPRALTDDGRTVTFAAGGEWALLRLVRRHAAGSAELGGGERGRHTLRLQVGTVRAAPGGRPDTAAAGPPARVFVRVRLFDPRTGEELGVPAFPAFAPHLRAPRGARVELPEPPHPRRTG